MFPKNPERPSHFRLCKYNLPNSSFLREGGWRTPSFWEVLSMPFSSRSWKMRDPGNELERDIGDWRRLEWIHLNRIFSHMLVCFYNGNMNVTSGMFSHGNERNLRPLGQKLHVIGLPNSRPCWRFSKPGVIGGFRVVFSLCVKASLYAKPYSFPCKSNSSSHERFCTKTRFTTEAQGNSEMACLKKSWKGTSAYVTVTLVPNLTFLVVNQITLTILWFNDDYYWLSHLKVDGKKFAF